MTYLAAYMYRQISKCTDKTPKKHYWGRAIARPLPLWGGKCPPITVQETPIFKFLKICLKRIIEKL